MNGGGGQFYIKEKGSLTVEELLKLRRSDQSGPKTLTGDYTKLYEDGAPYPWIFAGGMIDLTGMGAGDKVYIMVTSKLSADGYYLLRSENSYSFPQNTVSIGAFANLYGMTVEAYQSAGAPPYVTVDTEFFTAKR